VSARLGQASARLAELAAAADDDDTGDGGPSALALIKSVPGNVSLESTLTEIGKLAAISAFYDAGWKARRAGDVVLVKTLLYTGVRVAELVRIRIDDGDLDACRIRITQGKGGKDRAVLFPDAFKETLALHIGAQRRIGAAYLFESSWKKPYSERGVLLA
jgi:integrase